MQRTWGDNPRWGRTGYGGGLRGKRRMRVVFVPHRYTSWQSVTVPVSTQSWGDALGDASGPAALVAQPEEPLGRRAAPAQPLPLSFLGVWSEPVHRCGR